MTDPTRFVVAPDRELLEMVGNGLSTPDAIAEATGMELSEVRERLSIIIETLSAKNPTDAWARASLRHGGPVPGRLSEPLRAITQSSHRRPPPIEIALLEAHFKGVTIQSILEHFGVSNVPDAIFVAHSAGLLLPQLTDKDREILRHTLLGHSPAQCQAEFAVKYEVKNLTAAANMRAAVYQKIGATDLVSAVALLIPASQLPPLEEYRDHIARAKRAGFSYEDYQVIWATADRGLSRKETAKQLGWPLNKVGRIWKKMFAAVGLKEVPGGPYVRDGILAAILLWADEPFRVPTPDPLLNLQYQRVLYAMALSDQAGIDRLPGLDSTGRGIATKLHLIFESPSSRGSRPAYTTIARAVRAEAMQVPPWQAGLLQHLRDEKFRDFECELLRLMIGGQSLKDIKQHPKFHDADSLLITMRRHAGVVTTENLIFLACLADPDLAKAGFEVKLEPGQALLEDRDPEGPPPWAGLEPRDPSAESTPDPPEASPPATGLSRLSPKQMEAIGAWMVCATWASVRSRLGGLSEDEYSTLCDSVLDATGLKNPSAVVAWAKKEGFPRPPELDAAIQRIEQLQSNYPGVFAKDQAVWRVWAEGGGTGRSLEVGKYTKTGLGNRRKIWKDWGLLTEEMTVAAAAYAGAL